MKLSKIIENLQCNKINFEDLEIDNLMTNSKYQKPNSLFFCYQGISVDSHDFVNEAIDNGAIALIVEKNLNVDIPQILVEDTRQAISIIASNFYNNPHNKLKIIGITGTNGKTTTTNIVANILQKCGKKVGIIGTNGAKIMGQKYFCSLTTPDPIELNSLFAEMVKKQVEYVVMEVSAHAIALSKISNIEFLVGAITNITQDHIDFFETMDNYALTKLSFLNACPNIAINVDDDYCKRYVKQREGKSITYGANGNISYKNAKYYSKKTVFNLIINGKSYKAKTSLLGNFNIYNVMCATAIAISIGVKTKDIIKGIKQVHVDGRLELVPGKIHVAIDYAHTPDGLQKVLESVKQFCEGKIITVFGCGGNRDKKKRKIMGEVASRLSDVVIVTSDNPRDEDPEKIIEDIKEGITCDAYYITDRKIAIYKAMDIARKKDIVLICGKGAEDYQEIKGIKYPFSDYEIVKEYYKK